MTLLALACAWLLGVLLAGYFDRSMPALGLFAVASAFVLILLALQRRSILPALAITVLLLGTLRAELSGADPGSGLAPYHGHRALQVQGVVINDPEPAGSVTRLRLRVEKVRPGADWVTAAGDVLVTLRESTELIRQRDRPYFRYGDELLLEGSLEAPRALEGFDYPAYLERQGIGSVMSFPEVTLLEEDQGFAFYRWLYGLRQDIASSLARAVPEPQASLGQAILLGLRKNLPQGLTQEFLDTGTTHILAISGLNLSILLGITLAVSQGLLGRRRQLYLILPFILMWLYALISGMSPSVARAAIMGSVYLAALSLGRPRSVVPALGFAAAVMVAITPDVLWNISFQLSVAAMAGMAILADPLGRWLRSLYAGRLGEQGMASSIFKPLSVAVAATVAATVVTLPLIAFYFHRVSPVGIPATLLTLPALPPIMVTQALTGLVGLVSSAASEPFGWLAWLPTAYLSGVIGVAARVPSASVETGLVGPVVVWAYYGALVLFLVRSWFAGTVRRGVAVLMAVPRPSLPGGKGVPWWVLAPAAALAALLWIAALSFPDSRLHVFFIDVGQGDAALVITPGGQQVLVDGGPGPMDVVHLLGEKMPFRDRTIELVVLTHPHHDHAGGLVEVLDRYKVSNILEREFAYDSPTHEAWRRAVAAEGAQVVQAQSGQVISFGDGLFIHVLGPPEKLLQGTQSDVDNASVVLRLVYHDVSFLLAADMFEEAEMELVRDGASIDSDVLKVSHHGSRNASSPGFLAGVTPAVAVISAGKDNQFGHPHREAMEALKRLVPGDRILLTRDKGTIEFVTDGRRLEVRSER